MNNFLSFLKKNHPNYASALQGNPGTQSFNVAWSDLAKRQPQQFEKVQRDFIKSTHYDPAKNRIEKDLGFELDRRSPALQNVVWSTSVQHGSTGAYRVFKNAGVKPGMTDEQIIRRVYAERMADNGKRYFSSSSDAIRKSVVNRFKKEMVDALNMLG